MTTTRTTTTEDLPQGWAVETCRPRLQVGRWEFGVPFGWVIEGVFYLALAPDHVRAEAEQIAAAFVEPVEARETVGERWSLFKHWMVRRMSMYARYVEEHPRSEWLDSRFLAGPPDAALREHSHGHPIALRYNSGRDASVTVDLSGYLRVSAWTSIGMTYRAYIIDHDLPGQDGKQTALSEFGTVWDVRAL